MRLLVEIDSETGLFKAQLNGQDIEYESVSISSYTDNCCHDGSTTKYHHGSMSQKIDKNSEASICIWFETNEDGKVISCHTSKNAAGKTLNKTIYTQAQDQLAMTSLIEGLQESKK